MATMGEVQSFQEFAMNQIQNGGAMLSIEQLFDLWQVENLTDSELRDSAAAVQAALEDMKSGDLGRPVDNVVDELLEKAGN